VSRRPIYVSQPIVPDLDEFIEMLNVALNTRRLTNGGPLVSMLELRLQEMLRVPYVSLVSNGTVAIEVAARALGMRGKVITTPFTFSATLNALLWIGLEPILVDVEDDFLTIDPTRIEEAFTSDVSGIVGAHVYGNPCNTTRIDAIGVQQNVPVLYDGAHVFDATIYGDPIVAAGTATTLSFHATKFFNTAEGGAIVTPDANISDRISKLKNFGIASEDTIVDVGINAKMSELNAAFGLANLTRLPQEKLQREAIIATYSEVLSSHDAIKLVARRPGTSERHQYFPIRLAGRRDFSLRDKVYAVLRGRGIFARRYFYPLLSDVEAIRARLTQKHLEFPIAEKAAGEVLVLPLHGGLTVDDAIWIGEEVIEAINV
jgi:dTDP-4-amino-4,6-dideoxy-D-glucose transaminase